MLLKILAVNVAESNTVLLKLFTVNAGDISCKVIAIVPSASIPVISFTIYLKVTVLLLAGSSDGVNVITPSEIVTEPSDNISLTDRTLLENGLNIFMDGIIYA